MNNIKKILFYSILFFWCQYSLAALQIEDTSIGGAESYNATVEHTVSGSNAVLYVSVIDENSGNNISSVKYNNVSLIKSVFYDGTAEYSSIWYLSNPDVGTYDIVVTNSIAKPSLVIAITVSGAKIQAPEASNSGGADDYSKTVDITTLTNNALLIGCAASNTNSGTFQNVANQTLILQGNAPGGSSFDGACYSKTITTAGNNSITATKDNSTGLALSVVSIAEASGAPPQIF